MESKVKEILKKEKKQILRVCIELKVFGGCFARLISERLKKRKRKIKRKNELKVFCISSFVESSVISFNQVTALSSLPREIRRN